MYPIKLINEKTTIGDSLIDINANYTNIDLWTQSIASSATFFWEPLTDLYTYISPKWEKAISLVQQNSATWLDFASTVQTNSAFWIQPTSIIYPQPLPSLSASKVEDLQKLIQSWLTSNFPVSSEGFSKPRFLENKRFLVSIFFQTSSLENRNTYKQVYRQCEVTDTNTLNLQCITNYSGIAYCSNGNLNCNGYRASCGISTALECFFLSFATGEGVYETNLPGTGLSPTSHSKPGNDEQGALVLESISKTSVDNLLSDVAGYMNTLGAYDMVPNIFYGPAGSGGSYTAFPVESKRTALGSLHGYFFRRYTNKYEDNNTAFRCFSYIVKNCGWEFEKEIQIGNSVKPTEIKTTKPSVPNTFTRFASRRPVAPGELVKRARIYLPRTGSRGALPTGIDPNNILTQNYLLEDNQDKFYKTWNNSWVGGYATWAHNDNNNLPFEDQYGIWVVPNGVERIKIAICGTGGLAGEVFTDVKNTGYNLPANYLIASGEYILGSNGQPVTSGFSPGQGRAGAGGSPSVRTGNPLRWWYGSGAGGGPAWGYFIMEVEPGLKFRFSLARPNFTDQSALGIISPADSWFHGGPENNGFFSDNWVGMRAGHGAQGDQMGGPSAVYTYRPFGGTGGYYTGYNQNSGGAAYINYHNGISLSEVKSYKGTPGQDGALGYDEDGNPANKAGYICIDLNPDIII